MAISLRALVNGRETDCVDIGDRGLAYGDGVFETIAVCDRRPLCWDLHLDRLFDGARHLGLPVPERSALVGEVQALCADTTQAVLKIILTRGSGQRGYRSAPGTPATRIVTVSPWVARPPSWQSEGVAVRLCQQSWSRQPALAGLKHLNRLEQVLARAEWSDEYAEGLMRDPVGDVISGTASNLFLVVDGVLFTPDLSDSGVLGIMRGQVGAAALRLNVAYEVRRISLPFLIERADEVFLTNSLIGIWPVRSIEGRHYHLGEVTRTLQHELIRQGLAADY